MPAAKTITISLPEAMGREIEKVAKEEHRTISELLREAFRQYQPKEISALLLRQDEKLLKEKS
jgi:metal-responsive CopG/Arc/MetJ family transcriptional regulator